MSLELIDPETQNVVGLADMGMASYDYLKECVLWDTAVSPDLMHVTRLAARERQLFYTSTFSIEDACGGNWYNEAEETLYALRRKVVAVRPSEETLKAIAWAYPEVQVIVVEGESSAEIVNGVIEALLSPFIQSTEHNQG